MNEGEFPVLDLDRPFAESGFDTPRDDVIAIEKTDVGQSKVTTVSLPIDQDL